MEMSLPELEDLGHSRHGGRQVYGEGKGGKQGFNCKMSSFILCG